MSDREVDRLFRESNYSKAAEYLKSRMKQGAPGGPGSEDELLYLLDAGLALHQAGEYEQSNAYFALAEKHSGLNDFTSISEEAGTLLTSENTKVYRGEDFEKVLIHVYKAMNYALLGGIEDALVEARLVHRRLEQIKQSGQKSYRQNAFARYLSAILYEAAGEYNDAYIDYKKTYEIEPQYRVIGLDLWRMASVLGFEQDMARWKREFQLDGHQTDRSLNRVLSKKSGKGEIIVLFQNGISPIKRPDPAFPSIPQFVPRLNPVKDAEVIIDGVAAGKTSILHDIEATAVAALEEKKLRVLTKRLAGRVTKAVVADQVRQKTNSELLGFVTGVALIISDQADTRSWSLLPRDLQVFRIPVESGVHEVRLRLATGTTLSSPPVEVVAGKKVLLSFRYLP